MPEFEEPEATSNSQQSYTPSKDATNKPRTRRRSGGFKTEYTPPSTGIGEVNPTDALKNEKLSGSAKAEPKAQKEPRAPRTKKPEAKAERPAPTSGNAQPSPETLAAIKRVEERLEERKKERDAKRAEREKNRSAKNESRKDSSRGSNRSSTRKSSSKKQKSGGLIASILSFFGLGPKEPAKKQGSKGKSSGNRGQGRRPRSKSGSRSQGEGRKQGQGQNRRGGQGRRSGGKSPRRKQEQKS